MNQVFADALLPPDDHGIERATKRAVATMRERYGDDLVGVYLFGSRARGDYETGAELQITVLAKSEWLDPSRSERPGHVREIRRDATDLLTSFWEE